MTEKVLHYDTQKAIKAQQEYCEKHHVSMYAPRSGCCFRCHNPIYIMPSGYSVEEASSTVITHCPYCRLSFID